MRVADGVSLTQRIKYRDEHGRLPDAEARFTIGGGDVAA